MAERENRPVKRPSQDHTLEGPGTEELADLRFRLVARAAPLTREAHGTVERGNRPCPPRVDLILEVLGMVGLESQQLRALVRILEDRGTVVLGNPLLRELVHILGALATEELEDPL